MIAELVLFDLYLDETERRYWVYVGLGKLYQ
jgi:hypothetical protein